MTARCIVRLGGMVMAALLVGSVGGCGENKSSLANGSQLPGASDSHTPELRPTSSKLPSSVSTPPSPSKGEDISAGQAAAIAVAGAGRQARATVDNVSGMSYRKAAQQYSGGNLNLTIPNETVVWVVSMTGAFVGGHHPPNVPAPTFSHAYSFVQASNGAILEFGELPGGSTQP